MEGVPEEEERAGPSFGTPQASRPPPIHRGVDGRVPRRRRRNRQAPPLGVVRGSRALHALRSRRGVGARRSRPRATLAQRPVSTIGTLALLLMGAAVLPPRAAGRALSLKLAPEGWWGMCGVGMGWVGGKRVSSADRDRRVRGGRRVRAHTCQTRLQCADRTGDVRACSESEFYTTVPQKQIIRATLWISGPGGGRGRGGVSVRTVSLEFPFCFHVDVPEGVSGRPQ